jgi:uncharacterized integral membrane protein
MNLSIRILTWIVTAPIVALVVLFSVSNLDQVPLHLWPLPFDLNIAIWLMSLIELFVGFLLGAIVTWMSDGRRRRNARMLARRVKDLEQQLAEARDRAGPFDRPAAEQNLSLAAPS